MREDIYPSPLFIFILISLAIISFIILIPCAFCGDTKNKLQDDNDRIYNENLYKK